MPPAIVYVRWSDLALEWLEAVAALLAAVEDADPVMVEGPVADAAARLRETIWRNAEAA